MNAIATVTCPKCSAVGSFRHFAHIQAGVCFLCNGAKTVTMTTASRWLASQMRGDMVPAGTTPTVAKPARPSKTVDMGAWGKVIICRLDDGTFTARDVVAGNSDTGFYTVYFRVTAGRVVVDADCIQVGMTKHWRAFERALQVALKM